MGVERVQLGRSGSLVSEVGLGTWQAGLRGWGTDYSRGDVEQAISLALDRGINFFDTAEMYGRGASEEVLGGVIHERREEVVLATKVSPWHLSEHSLKAAVDASLKRLGTEYVDLYQIHFPPSYYTSLRKTFHVLEHFVMDGKIKFIGVSNFSKSLLAESRTYLSKVDIVSNQVEYSLLCRWPEEELLPYCRQEGISIIAYSPLAQGMLTGKYHSGNLTTRDVRSHNKLFRPKNFKKFEGLLAILRDVAAKRNVTPGQVALNWLLCQQVIPIPGAKKPSQVSEIAGASDWRLTESELNNVRAAASEAGITLGNEVQYMSVIRLIPDHLIELFFA